MFTNFPWRDKDWFTEQFIYSGKSIKVLSEELNLDWSSIERWRKIHDLPRHTAKNEIIEKFGEAVWTNIASRKSKRYSVSNKRKAELTLTNRTYEDIYGEQKASIIKKKISNTNKNVLRTLEFKNNLSNIQTGSENSNWKAGFYSNIPYKNVDSNKVKAFILNSWNRYIVIEKDFTCADCGIKSFNCNGHHIISFTLIFDIICNYLNINNMLSTSSVIKELHLFHKENSELIYECLCIDCHRKIHRQENLVKRSVQENQLLYLLKKYISNPEPSLIQYEEGAETIEITIVQSE